MIAGIIFSLLASIAINLGNLVEKTAVGRMPEISIRRSRHLVWTLVSSRLWMLGFILCLIGLGLQVLALSLASIPVVQSIFNAGIVILVVGSRVHLRERLHRREWVGLAVVVLSLVSLSVSLTGSTNAVGVGGSGLMVLVAAAPTIIVVIVVAAFIRSGRGNTGFLFGIAAGLLYGVATLGTKGASTLVGRYGVAASVTHMVVSAYPYLFVVFSVFGLLVYQTGLQRSRIAVVGSMSDVVCSTYLVGVGTLVFREHLPTDTLPLTLRIVGFVGVLIGSVLVAGGGTTASGIGMVPPVEIDLGLGPSLIGEIESLKGHPGSTSRAIE